MPLPITFLQRDKEHLTSSTIDSTLSIFVRHKPVLKHVLEPFRPLWVSGRNGANQTTIRSLLENNRFAVRAVTGLRFLGGGYCPIPEIQLLNSVLSSLQFRQHKRQR